MSTIIASTVTGTVWKIEAREGDLLAAGQSLLLVESMKMEIAIEAPARGRLLKLHVVEGEGVAEGQALASFEPASVEPASFQPASVEPTRTDPER